MCLIAWRWQPSAVERLVLLSNRDEFFDRPTQALAAWTDVPVWAGRDGLAGGTWLGVGRQGRLAAVTNYRSAHAIDPEALSRGHLVCDFLQSSQSPTNFAQQLMTSANLYNPFNLLMFDGHELIGFEGRGVTSRWQAYGPGDGSVSNADFDSPWPKQVMLKQQLAQQLTTELPSDEVLLDLMRNSQTAPVQDLPQTGVGDDKELALSAMFVRLPGYGTRASTLVRVRADHVRMHERSFDPQGQLISACVVEVREPAAPRAHQVRET